MNDDLDSLYSDDDFDDVQLDTPAAAIIEDDDTSTSNDDTSDDSDLGENNQTQEDDNKQDDDIIVAYLKSKGISNPSAIKYADEQGNIQEVDFNSLSREEQLNILNSSDVDINYGLDDNESELINLLRENNLTVEQYLDYVKEQAINDFITENSTPHYAIDDLTDEELYLLDLQATVKDVSEDEAKLYLEHDKTNESLWAKKIQTLRETYKAKEQAKLEDDSLIEEDKAKTDRKEFEDSMKSAITNLNKVGSFDLEDEDKERIAEFVLGTDATGTNYMYRALNDPNLVAKIAWFLLDGEESFDTLNEYWAGVVKQHSETKYAEGFKDAKDGKTSKVTVRAKQSKSSKDKPNKPVFMKIGDGAPELDLD